MRSGLQVSGVTGPDMDSPLHNITCCCCCWPRVGVPGSSPSLPLPCIHATVVRIQEWCLQAGLLAARLFQALFHSARYSALFSWIERTLCTSRGPESP